VKRLFSKKIPPAILVDADSTPFDFNAKVRVILSPSFYWVKRQKLPIKTLFQAKKYFHAVFDGLLPVGNFTYDVYKEGEYFYFFAFDALAITQRLTALNIHASKIISIHFAQSLRHNINAPLLISEHSVLDVQNGVVVRLPRAISFHPVELHLAHLELPKDARKIAITHHGHHLAWRQWAIPTLLAILLLLFVGENIAKRLQISALDDQQHALYAKHNLPTTSIQNRAILDRYTTIKTEQEKIRTILNAIYRIPMPKNSYLFELNVAPKLIEATIVVPNQQTFLAIKHSLLQQSHHFRIKRIELVELVVYLEIVL
jgi:hypothetical protein